MKVQCPETPRGNLEGMRKYVANDCLSGFLVFLIALPLCLGIAMASGYPPIAGIFTAIIGGILCTLFSDSELTIKGPAAGLIVIALGAVQEFSGGDPERMHQAYRLALGVGVAAGCLQILFGLFRSGVLGELFPTSVVHGMLAAIGVIIASKQIHTLLGVTPEAKEPLHLIAEIPHSFRNLNPEVALIGLISLVILFGLPLTKHPLVRRIPAPMLVLMLAIPLGMYFDLLHEHTYLFLDHHEYTLGPRFLVSLPDSLFSAITFPDFSGLLTVTGLKYVLMFALVGSLESLLSAKAIDLLDPWHRKTNLDRDLVAIGVANTASAMVGGLPMISEIVRSSANINNGARTRFANMYHGLFLLLFVALFPALIHRIPLAALGAMLVYTGYRLASPREWVHAYRIGREQLVIFTVTVIVVLATDLLVGIAVGVCVNLFIHVLYGVPLRALFKPDFAVEERDQGTVIVTMKHSAVFSGWLRLRARLLGLKHGQQALREVLIDLSESDVVDHTVLEKLHELQKDYAQANCKLTITGLNGHQKLSSHPSSTHVRRPLLAGDLRLLVGLKLDDGDAALIDYTAFICRLGLVKRVRFVHVSEESNGDHEALRRTLEQRIKRDFTVSGGVEVSFELLLGPVMDRLQQDLRERQSDVIVLGTNAAGRRKLARRLVMHAPSSLWLVPKGARAELQRILVPVDFSDAAADAVRVGLTLARQWDAVCAPLHVYSENALMASDCTDGRIRAEKDYQQFMVPFDSRGLKLQPHFVEAGNIPSVIQRVAEQENADLIVMAPRGLSQSAAILLGSVTEETLEQTRVPMLVIKRAGPAQMSLMRALRQMLRKPDAQFN